jgi:hypothetical protein
MRAMTAEVNTQQPRSHASSIGSPRTSGVTLLKPMTPVMTATNGSTPSALRNTSSTLQFLFRVRLFCRLGCLLYQDDWLPP